MTQKSYKHLSVEERDLIAILHSGGKSLRDIAKRLNRNPATISRELFRNAAPVNRGYYLPHKANERAARRNKESQQRTRLKLPCIRRYVRDHIRMGWSPELIAGRWRKLHADIPISHEAIYQWLYSDANDLVPYLVRAHKKRKRRGYSKKHSKPHIPGRIDISKRPKHIAKRKEPGHWESDTAVSRQSKVVLQVSVERKTRFSLLAKLPRRQAKEMRIALNRKLCRIPKHLRKSITYDNGTENTAHQEVNAVLGTKSYFCTPFHSWERGTNENTIGLARRFLPKKTDFATVSNKRIREIESWLNNRPRKCLNYSTPAEAFKAECCT